jgi:hypothetical protein
MNKVLASTVSYANFVSIHNILINKINFINTFSNFIKIVAQFVKFREKIPLNWKNIFGKIKVVKILYQIRKAGNLK